MNYTVSPIKNLEIVLNNQRNPYLNWATHKKDTCQILLPPQKSTNRKFQTQTNPFIIPVTWNPEYPPGYPPPLPLTLPDSHSLGTIFDPPLAQVGSLNRQGNIIQCLITSNTLSTCTFLQCIIPDLEEKQGIPRKMTPSPLSLTLLQPLNYCLTSTSSSNS